MNGFIICAGHQSEGSAFELDPRSQVFLEDQYPDVRPVVSVYLAYQDPQDLAAIRTSTWSHIAELLTDLSEAEIQQLGGFEVVEEPKGRVVYRSHQAADAA